MAISKAEKAREKEERKAQRQLARQIVREQLAHEKEERQAIREAQRAKKAIETVKRKQEAEEQRAQRMQQKEAKKRSVQSKKRALKDDGVDQPQKRVRMTVSLTRNAGDSHASSIGLNTRVPKQSTCMISNAKKALNDIHEGVQSEDPISQFGRSGRAIRLPTRFK
jgi:hypothetical protein